MASWFRAAEELFEVVDRTAKQVVRDGSTEVLKSSSTTTPLKEKVAIARSPTQSAKQLDTAALSDGADCTSPAEDFHSSSTDAQMQDKAVHKGNENAAEKLCSDRANTSEEVQPAENGHYDVGDYSEEAVKCRMATFNDDNVVVKLYTQKPLELTAEPEIENELLPETKVEDAVEEANALLQDVTTSFDKSTKEARLAKVCAGLRSRVKELKAENVQLEELLQQEKETKKSIGSIFLQMQEDLAIARSASNSVELEMSSALASKNKEIEVLLENLANVKQQARASEAKLASVQVEMESLLKNQDITETRMIHTLKQELLSAERRAEEAHAAHSATRMAAVERETELEQRVAEATAALTKMQKTVDERTQRSADLEQKISMLEMECATLNQELQGAENKVRREQTKVVEDNVNPNVQLAWRDEAERARQAQREAETKVVALEAECQKLRVELASSKRDNDYTSTQAHTELERRFRELTELLYLKQTQLESMASEKAAVYLQLEKESKRFREAKAEIERSRRQFSSIGDDDENGLLSSFDSLHHRNKLVGPSIQTAAKFLDSGAVTAGRFLWRRPIARIFALFYLVFVHLFLMYLLHRLQERTVSAEEARV